MTPLTICPVIGLVVQGFQNQNLGGPKKDIVLHKWPLGVPKSNFKGPPNFLSPTEICKHLIEGHTVRYISIFQHNQSGSLKILRLFPSSPLKLYGFRGFLCFKVCRIYRAQWRSSMNKDLLSIGRSDTQIERKYGI